MTSFILALFIGSVSRNSHHLRSWGSGGALFRPQQPSVWGVCHSRTGKRIQALTSLSAASCLRSALLWQGCPGLVFYSEPLPALLESLPPVPAPLCTRHTAASPRPAHAGLLHHPLGPVMEGASLSPRGDSGEHGGPSRPRQSPRKGSQTREELITDSAVGCVPVGVRGADPSHASSASEPCNHPGGLFLTDAGTPRRPAEEGSVAGILEAEGGSPGMDERWGGPKSHSKFARKGQIIASVCAKVWSPWLQA